MIKMHRFSTVTKVSSQLLFPHLAFFIYLARLYLFGSSLFIYRTNDSATPNPLWFTYSSPYTECLREKSYNETISCSGSICSTVNLDKVKLCEPDKSCFLLRCYHLSFLFVFKMKKHSNWKKTKVKKNVFHSE